MAVSGLPRPIGFVLGGGGSLGAMQVGMLQALSESEVAPNDNLYENIENRVGKKNCCFQTCANYTIFL